MNSGNNGDPLSVPKKPEFISENAWQATLRSKAKTDLKENKQIVK